MDRKLPAKETSGHEPYDTDELELEVLIYMMSRLTFLHQGADGLDNTLGNLHLDCNEEGAEDTRRLTRSSREARFRALSEQMASILAAFQGDGSFESFRLSELITSLIHSPRYTSVSSFRMFRTLLQVLLRQRQEILGPQLLVSDINLFQIGYRVLTTMFGDSQSGPYTLGGFTIAVADILRELDREDADASMATTFNNEQERMRHVASFGPREEMNRIAESVPSECINLEWVMTQIETEELLLEGSDGPPVPPLTAPPAPAPAPAPAPTFCDIAPKLAGSSQDSTEGPPTATESTTTEEEKKEKGPYLKVPMIRIPGRFLVEFGLGDFRQRARALSGRDRKVWDKLVYAVKKAQGEGRIMPTKKRLERKNKDDDEATGYLCGACRAPVKGHVCQFVIQIPEELWEVVRRELSEDSRRELDEWRERQNGRSLPDGDGSENNEGGNDEDSVRLLGQQMASFVVGLILYVVWILISMYK